MKIDGERRILTSLHILTCYDDVFGDIAVHVSDIVESQTGVQTTLVLADTEHLQQWTCGAH